MSTKSEIKAINKYNKENTKIMALRLNLKTDADIVTKLEQVPSKMGYIKDLIRKDMEQGTWSDTDEVLWVETDDSFGVETAYACPKCKHAVPESRRSNFCPNCGLKLSKGTDEGSW